MSTKGVWSFCKYAFYAYIQELKWEGTQGNSVPLPRTAFKKLGFYTLDVIHKMMCGTLKTIWIH